MRKEYCNAILWLSLIMGLFQSARAEWTLPTSIAEFEHNARFPHAIAVGETLHVVVTTDYCYPYIHYFRSLDNGMSWTEPDNPVIPYGPSGQARLFFADGLIHLTWYGEGQNPPESFIFHITSSDGGRTWSEIAQLPFFQAPTADHRLAGEGNMLFFASRGYSSLYWARSSSRGQMWDVGGFVEQGDIYIGPISINLFFSQGRLHLIYRMTDWDYHPYGAIYHRYSDNHGDTWSNKVRLSSIESPPGEWGHFDQSAYVDCDGNLIALWVEDEYGCNCYHSGDIVGVKSSDNGNTWSEEFRLSYTEGFAKWPTCLVLGESYYALWEDRQLFGCGIAKINYTESTDGGGSWTEPEIISGPDEVSDRRPLLFYSMTGSDTVLHCITDRGNEIYYMTDNEINFEPEFSLCPEGGDAEVGWPICFDVAGEDVNGFNDLHITLIEGPGEYVEEVGGQGGFTSGVWCWDDPALGDYTVVLGLDDNAGGISYCEFEINVMGITLEIGCVPGFAGGIVVVPVILHTTEFLTGGMEILINWDPAALQLTDVIPLSRIDMGNEYFYWDIGDPCDPPCDEGGAVRVTWISDINDGVPHDPAPAGSDPVFNLVFEIDPALPWGMNIPVGFLNQHYSDNTISDPSGYIWRTPQQINGCVEVVDPATLKGDPNWNGWYFEIGDAVLVARRLIYGLIIWEEDGAWNDAYQEAAGDLNNNGFVDVADLVMFINIINDVTPPPYKPEPGSAIAEVSMTEATDSEVIVTISSALDIGAALVIIEHSGFDLGTPVSASGMELLFHAADGVMNVIVFSMEADVVPAGSSALFTIPVLSNDGGVMSFRDVSSSDAYGNLLETLTDPGVSLPTNYSFEQNYPNPFNSTTVLNYSLVQSGPVRIMVYDILGQRVAMLCENVQQPGRHSVVWNALDFPSGVYFARLEAEGESRTIKMVLLK